MMTSASRTSKTQRSPQILILLFFGVLISGCATYHHLEVINDSGRYLDHVTVEYPSTGWDFGFGNAARNAIMGHGFVEQPIPESATVTWRDPSGPTQHTNSVPVRRYLPAGFRQQEDTVCLVITSESTAACAFWGHQPHGRFLEIPTESKQAKAQRLLNSQLIASLRRRDIETASNLLVQGAQADCHDVGTGVTPLLAAIPYVPAMQLVLANGAPVGDEISLSARTGSIPAVAALLAAGGNVNHHIPWGKTPLSAAVDAGHQRMVEYLISKGADVNMPTYNGITPIYIAVLRRQHAIAEVLMLHGADPTISLEGHKWTAIDQANRQQDVRMVAILTGGPAERKGTRRHMCQ